MSAHIALVQKRNLPDAAVGLPMPNQNFDASFVDHNSPGIREVVPYLERCLVWGAPFFLSILFVFSLGFLFTRDGSLQTTETVLLILTTLLFAWESVPATTALLGLMTKPKIVSTRSAQVLNVAILLPMHGEDAGFVIGNGVSLFQSLSVIKTHRFKLFVLSDTGDQKLCVAERTMVENADVEICYHNRPKNTDYKSGNIRAWIEREAADYDAMLVLDADSQMTGDCVIQLVDRLAANPSLGLVQSMPKVLRGETLWQWTQFYAAKIYGPALGRGSARWMGTEANYYGHNAIIRTKAFAACAGLPRIRNEYGFGETIMSHDFVEAALLRRAGWGVQFLPELDGSFEAAPRSLIDFIKRDARWGYGNLQHLQILGAKGFHGVSRWHLFHGAMTYMNSILWFSALILWAGLINNLGMVSAASTGSVVSIVLVILVPKFIGLFGYAKQIPHRNLRIALFRDFLFELIVSTIVTPTLMMQRIKTVVRFALGLKTTWPVVSALHPDRLDILRFHIFEVFVGLGMLTCALIGALSFFILPVAFCLIFSPVLSWGSIKDTTQNSCQTYIVE
jgi:membrane glycosyltransferase